MTRYKTAINMVLFIGLILLAKYQQYVFGLHGHDIDPYRKGMLSGMILAVGSITVFIYQIRSWKSGKGRIVDVLFPLLMTLVTFALLFAFTQKLHAIR